VRARMDAAMSQSGRGKIGRAFLWDPATDGSCVGATQPPEFRGLWMTEYKRDNEPSIDLGPYTEKIARRVRDLLALKLSFLKGEDVRLLFPLSDYEPTLQTVYETPEKPFLLSPHGPGSPASGEVDLRAHEVSGGLHDEPSRGLLTVAVRDLPAMLSAEGCQSWPSTRPQRQPGPSTWPS